MSRLFHDEGKPAEGRQKIMLATVCYDRPSPMYTFDLQRSRLYLYGKGVNTSYVLLSGNCHVDDARNSVVCTFMASDCTDLVFLDADVGWGDNELFKLCSHTHDLIGGVYPFRREGDPVNVPVVMLPDAAPDDDGLLEVEGLPTGFMKIRRRVIETLHAADDRKHWQRGDRSVPCAPLFERTFQHAGTDGRVTGVRWGGDLSFCRKWRATGGKVFADTTMRLKHVGDRVHSGSLGAALRIRAGTTLSWIAHKVRSGSHTLDDLSEARDYIGNPYGATEEFLATCVGLVRKLKHGADVLELGSGLSSILVAAAAKEGVSVYAVENAPEYAERLKGMAVSASVSLALAYAPIDPTTGWYDEDELGDLPEVYDVIIVDGPSRAQGDRARVFEHIRRGAIRFRKAVIIDDVDTAAYRSSVMDFASSPGYDYTEVSDRVVVVHHTGDNVFAGEW